MNIKSKTISSNKLLYIFTPYAHFAIILQQFFSCFGAFNYYKIYEAYILRLSEVWNASASLYIFSCHILEWISSCISKELFKSSKNQKFLEKKICQWLFMFLRGKVVKKQICVRKNLTLNKWAFVGRWFIYDEFYQKMEFV